MLIFINKFKKQIKVFIENIILVLFKAFYITWIVFAVYIFARDSKFININFIQSYGNIIDFLFVLIGVVPFFYKISKLAIYEDYLKTLPQIAENIKTTEKIKEKNAEDKIEEMLKDQNITEVISTFIQPDIDTLYDQREYFDLLHKKFKSNRKNIKFKHIIQIPKVGLKKQYFIDFTIESTLEKLTHYRNKGIEIELILDARESNYPFINYTLCKSNKQDKIIFGWINPVSKNMLVDQFLDKLSKDDTADDDYDRIKDRIKDRIDEIVNISANENYCIYTENEMIINIFNQITDNFSNNSTEIKSNFQSMSIIIKDGMTKSGLKDELNIFLSKYIGKDEFPNGDKYNKTIGTILSYTKLAKYIYNDIIEEELKKQDKEIYFDFIEIACGTGTLISELLKINNSKIISKFIAIDKDEKQIEQMKSQIKDPSVEYFNADIFEESTIEKINEKTIIENIKFIFLGFNFINLFHSQDRIKFLKKLKKIKGAKIIVLDSWSQKYQIKNYQAYKFYSNKNTISFSYPLVQEDIRKLHLIFNGDTNKQYSYTLYLASRAKLHTEAMMAGWAHDCIKFEYRNFTQGIDKDIKNKMLILREDG